MIMQQNQENDEYHNVSHHNFLLQYIRLDVDINVDDAVLLLNRWKVPYPDLLISIIGDAKFIESNDKLAKQVASGLAQVSVFKDINHQRLLIMLYQHL